jgi:hypothetical protein
MRTVVITEIELNHAINSLSTKINVTKRLIADPSTFDSVKSGLDIELKALYQVRDSLEEKRNKLVLDSSR